jgi:hypothetical protein
MVNVFIFNSFTIWSSPEPITYTYNGKIFTNYLGNYWSDYTGSDADGDGIGDTPYNINSDKDNYPLMEPFENYFRTIIQPLPDLTIVSIKPVQVIWDCDINNDGWIDLVQGKATAVAVYIGGFETLSDEKMIEIELNFEKKYFTRITVGELKKEYGRIIFYIDLPQYLGNLVMSAQVDPSNYIEEINEGNNIKKQIVMVKDTKGLHISYFRVERPESYGGPYYPYIETVERSGEFIQAVYPISEIELINERRNEIIQGHAKITIGPLYFGIQADCREIAKQAKRLGADRGVGVVPYGYFDYHGVDAAGMSFPLVKGVVVEAGYWTTTAHEIAHTYQLRWPIEEYVTNPPGNPASGFWVVKKQSMENKICFMGKAMSFESFDTWICDDCYSYLFKKFIENKNDPEILVLDGIIYKNGTIEIGKWYRVEEGKDDLDEIIPGDYSLQVLDKNGNILQQISFSAEFRVSVHPLGVIETDFAPFTFAVSYPEGASIVKIFHKGEMITEIDLTTKLLNDGIDSLPSDYEMLIKTVEGAYIQHGIKNSLLSKLTNAKKKAEQGIVYINEGRIAQGKNMLNSASNIIEAFINEVNAQKGKKISEEDANEFISWAQKMILSLQNQIVDLLETK